jgi:hypothetical protein
MLIYNTPITPGLYDVHWTYTGTGQAVVSVEGEWAIDTAISDPSGVLRVHVDDFLTVEVQRYDLAPFALDIRPEAVPEPHSAALLLSALLFAGVLRRFRQ